MGGQRCSSWPSTTSTPSSPPPPSGSPSSSWQQLLVYSWHPSSAQLSQSQLTSWSYTQTTPLPQKSLSPGSFSSYNLFDGSCLSSPRMPSPLTSCPCSTCRSQTPATRCSCTQPPPTQPPRSHHPSSQPRPSSPPRRTLLFFLASQKSRGTARKTSQRLPTSSPPWPASTHTEMPRRTLRRKQADRSLRRRLTTSAPSSYLAEKQSIAPRGTRGPSNIPS